jgi:hypothetical protein
MFADLKLGDHDYMAVTDTAMSTANWRNNYASLP